MLKAGFLPDAISSDVHVTSIDGPAFDLLTTMSKFCAWGSICHRHQARHRGPRRGIKRPTSARSRWKRRRRHGDRSCRWQVRLHRFTGERLVGDKRLLSAGVVLPVSGGIRHERRSQEPSSPASSPRSRRRLYGLRDRDELARFSTRLLEAERAGTAVALKSPQAAQETPYVELLHDVHRDEAAGAPCCSAAQGTGRPARQCRRLPGQGHGHRGLAERIAFLNPARAGCPQVDRNVPKVRDDALHRDLSDMLRSHEINIERASERCGQILG